jgi:hypothetical protein
VGIVNIGIPFDPKYVHHNVNGPAGYVLPIRPEIDWECKSATTRDKEKRMWFDGVAITVQQKQST